MHDHANINMSVLLHCSQMIVAQRVLTAGRYEYAGQGMASIGAACRFGLAQLCNLRAFSRINL
jgi:predicted transcriptional regulator